MDLRKTRHIAAEAIREASQVAGFSVPESLKVRTKPFEEVLEGRVSLAVVRWKEVAQRVGLPVMTSKAKIHTSSPAQFREAKSLLHRELDAQISSLRGPEGFAEMKGPLFDCLVLRLIPPIDSVRPG